MKVALCFGGPSNERNISAGSIKPWVTWLEAAAGLSLSILFFDRQGRAWILPARYAFTNTCEDFESQLLPSSCLSDVELDAWFKGQDVVVPIIHGQFGEDGVLAQRLEQLGVAYVFSGPAGLADTFDKAACYRALGQVGLPTPKLVLMNRSDWESDRDGSYERARSQFGRAQVSDEESDLFCAIKPNRGGSSLGVSLVREDREEFDAAMDLAFAEDGEVLLESILHGTEFSVMVLDGRAGPVPLAPTEIVTTSTLYDTRAKYLHGSGARLFTPMRRPSEIIDGVRDKAVQAWNALGLRDMARIDGFLGRDGEITVTDINGISGMGFSSFGFLQTSLAGVGHQALLLGLLKRAARRAHVDLPVEALSSNSRERVHVLFGGPTSERQVSRQSGIFVGLCLTALGKDVRFIFMDQSCRYTEVGLFYALHHDVAEIEELIHSPDRRAEITALGRVVGADLSDTDFDPGPTGHDRNLHVGTPGDLKTAVEAAHFVFLALHGGPGEDGTLQAALELLNKPYNGCGPQAARLCADKIAALGRVRELDLGAGIGLPRQRAAETLELFEWTEEEAWEMRFDELCLQLGSEQIICKPVTDGCSTGVKLLATSGDLKRFVEAIVSLRPHLEEGEFGPGSRPMPMPVPTPHRWMFEQALVDLDAPALPTGDWNGKNLAPWITARRYVEFTCAVCEIPGRGLCAAVPSLTVAKSTELSLEEKFQQGVGTNLEIDSLYSEAVVQSIRERVLRLAKALNLEGYGRLDCFYDQSQDRLYLLEANTLCALTEATVFYSQMLSSFEASPTQALEWIVQAGQGRRCSPRA